MHKDFYCAIAEPFFRNFILKSLFHGFKSNKCRFTSKDSLHGKLSLLPPLIAVLTINFMYICICFVSQKLYIFHYVLSIFRFFERGVREEERIVHERVKNNMELKFSQEKVVS